MKLDPVKQIKDIVIQAEPILKRKKRVKEIDTINSYLSKIDKPETNILICGEFKRGKSSFINALIEQEICPVDIDIATAAVSIIKYGEKSKVTRQFGDVQNLKTETYDSLEEVARFAAGGNIDNTALLIIEIPNEKLKDGLVLIDTPGVGGLDPRHAFLTNFFLPKADIVLFITDKDQPITGSEMSFFNNKVIPFAKQKALIINKADLMKDSAETDKWIEEAKNRCSEGNNSLSVVAVSSKLKKKFVAKGRERDYIESNFGEVEQLVANLVDNYRKNLLLGLRDYIVAIFNELITPIKLQLDQIKEPNPKLIVDLEAEVNEFKEQRHALESPNSEYMQSINELIKKARKRVESKVNKEGTLISSSKLDDLLQNSELRSNPEMLEAEIQNLFSDLIFEADQQMDSAFANVMSVIGFDKDFSSSDEDFAGSVSVAPINRSVSEYAMNIGKAFLPSIGIFSIATILTGGLLIPATLALGFFVKSIRDMNRSKVIAEIRGKIQPQLHIAMQDIKDYVQERFDNFNKFLVSILKERNEKLIENMSSALHDLNVLKSESAQQKRVKANLLATEIKPMEQVLTCAKVFLTNPFDKNQ